MCVGIRWSNVVRSSILLVLVYVAACGAGPGLAARYDDLDRSSLVRGAACDRSDQDTTHFLHAPLYRACAVTFAAQRLASDMRPGSAFRVCFDSRAEGASAACVR